jgi:prevent-host-death family protein
MAWKLEDAKNGFSELVRCAAAEGPQWVTRHGKDVVVVVSAEDYARLVAPLGLVQFLQASPLGEAIEAGELDVDRPTDFGRDEVL